MWERLFRWIWPKVKKEVIKEFCYGHPNPIDVKTIHHADGRIYGYIRQWSGSEIISTTKIYLEDGEFKTL